ncbi:MAG: hypothetical protein HRT88_12745, partial [Lentisphaeraceae bacterium]|nr:hypothetical protein [Lentisphaeraceae bacterium]
MKRLLLALSTLIMALQANHHGEKLKSWKTTSGILKNKCFACHGAGGDDSVEPYVNDIKSLLEYKEEFIERVLDDQDMPPERFKAKYEKKYQVTEDKLKHMQLTDAERQVLKAWAAKGWPAFADFSKKEAVEVVAADEEKKVAPLKVNAYASLTNHEVEMKVIKLFDNKCTQCHVARTNASSSNARKKGSKKWRGIDFMKNLVNSQYDPRQKDWSKQDLHYTLKEDMPPKNAKHGRWQGDDWDLVSSWMKRGCPTTKTSVEPIHMNKVYQAILLDLQEVAEHRRKYIRYFTLTNLYNTPGESRSLDYYRFGLAKLINSLSTG